MSSGAFDDLHKWTGDEVEAESAAFQGGKAREFAAILPFAHEQSLHEAAAVVLKLDGSRWDFQKGPHDHVDVGVPKDPGVLVALLHSHPHVLAPSVVDWQTFLLSANIIQSHVICDGKTYSLHKPSGWQQPAGLTEQEMSDAFYSALIDAFDETEGLGQMPNDQEEREWALESLAATYGVQYRIGEHFN